MDDTKISLSLHFASGQIDIGDYQLDIQRQENRNHINITNSGMDFALNAIYEQILELMGDDEEFTVKVKSEAGGVTFDHMTADYYFNTTMEILHFGKREIQQENGTE
jgi:hypothetical protein